MSDQLAELTAEVIKTGEMKVDEIKEIQFLLKLIHESNMTEEDKQSTGACLFCLIDLSNRFIKARHRLYWINFFFTIK